MTATSQTSSCQSFSTFFQAYAVASSTGNSAQCIINIVFANQLQLNLHCFTSSFFSTGKGSTQTSSFNIATTVIASFAQTEEHYFCLRFSSRSNDIFVITVKHCKTISRQSFYNLAFSFANICHTAQKFHMGFTNIGNKTTVRLCNFAQFSNLSQTTHPHFHNSNVSISSNIQQSFGQANFIIKVTLSFYYIVLST